METTNSTARRMPEVRTALKEQQLARLEAKQRVVSGEIETTDYSEMYSKQPEQVAKKKANQLDREARRTARSALAASGVANARGGAEAFKGGDK